MSDENGSLISEVSGIAPRSGIVEAAEEMPAEG